MKRKAILSALALAAGVTLALVLMLASGGSTGEYHVGGTLVCYDCHTIHYSMQHGWDGGAVGTAPAPGGNWLAPGGPNTFLLKAPANTICLQCHDGSPAAPDVVELNFNTSPTQGRNAGALNHETGAAPYETWKGHTLDSTATPPGFNPAAAGFSATVYTPSNGLECVSCHTQHGRAAAYRNLGPRNLANPAGTFTVSYHLSTTNDTTRDVWINTTPVGIPGSRTAAEWNPFYDRANIFYNRNDGVTGTTKKSNNIDVHCGACHGNFHGGPTDTTVGGIVSGSSGSEFIRHPTAQVNIGDLSSGHSSLPNYVGGATKVKVYTNDYAAYTSSSPGCVSCHKAHGNQNPFGLIFLGQQATSVNDEGGWNSGQSQTLQEGLRNLCGQCHTQGN